MNKKWYESRITPEPKKKFDHRSAYEKDRCKVIHSYSFRRLQGKIQIVSGKESDFHRNRLTHSIEVASIAKNIFDNILYRIKKKKEILNFLESEQRNIEPLLYSIGLLHDIGHPPYGHGGESALNYKMRNNGGFEGNAQTLRLITRIDPLNLTYRTLLGILKYPSPYSSLVNETGYPCLDRRKSDDHSQYLICDLWAPPKCYYDTDEQTVSALLDYITEQEREQFKNSYPAPEAIPGHKITKYQTLDCSIMNLADDISYSIHDLEDAIFFKQVTKEDLLNFFEKQNFIGSWQQYPNQLLSDNPSERKQVISKLIHEAIIHTQIDEQAGFDDPIFKYYVKFENEAVKEFIKNLKQLVKEKLIYTQHVKSIIHGGKVLIMQLFDAIDVNPQMLLPPDRYKDYVMCKEDNSRRRVIADYISGMTDNYLFKMHQRIFGGNTQNTFDII
ncbi:TPA: anti-phage deoxyguanosine triphosphatase [Legionella pneumophila]|nr:dNTP triphosphohydrolase [Legionella pneumophila subsp. pneumophila]HAU1833375.1 dNTP triphosphohydrolase [Legionella pneumophila]HBD9288058.1 dGTPase [Legionella pneumophila]HDY2618198.1 dGTPase [Legionella pneumophila]